MNCVQKIDFNISGSVTRLTLILVTSNAINKQQTGKPFLQNTSASITRISGQNKMVVKDFIDFIYKKNSLLKRSQIN